MEKTIGRYLEPDEIVHHINEDKQDNRPENLELTTRPEHARLHFAGRKYPPRFRPRISKDDLYRKYIIEEMTLRDIATEIGISYGSLRKHCFFYAIKIRGKDPWLKRRKARR